MKSFLILKSQTEYQCIRTFDKFVDQFSLFIWRRKTCMFKYASYISRGDRPSKTNHSPKEKFSFF